LTRILQLHYISIKPGSATEIFS